MRNSIPSTNGLLKIKYILFAVMIGCAGASSHAQSKWIDITSSTESNMRWDAQPGSLEFSKTKGGAAIVVIVGRMTDTRTSRINLYKWYVSADDCGRKMGKVVTLNIDGTYQFENDFVFGSGNISTAMVEFICGAADYVVNKSQEKSL